MGESNKKKIKRKNNYVKKSVRIYARKVNNLTNILGETIEEKTI